MTRLSLSVGLVFVRESEAYNDSAGLGPLRKTASCKRDSFAAPKE